MDDAMGDAGSSNREIPSTDPTRVKLLAVPASHPCAAVAAMLDAKGVPYARVDLFPGLSRAWLRLCGFPRGTVPALRAGAERVQGSRSIARWLDERQLEPPFFPADEEARFRVEAIETWADGPLQDAARQIILWALLRSRRAVGRSLDGAHLQFKTPAVIARLAAWPVLRLDAAINGVSDDTVRQQLASLPALLDRVDAWIAAGDLGGNPPSAADYEVAGSIRLLLTVDDLEPIMRGRPTSMLACTLIPVFPGRVEAGVLPRAWLG